MEFLSKSGLSFFKSLLDLYFATKSYVNKAISTNTGKFWGTYNSLADLQKITGSNGDYAYVIVTEDYSTSYDRYKWQDGQWVYEYTVGGEAFDDAQWAAINSGITASDKARLTEISNNIGNNSISEMRSDIDAERVHADSLIFDVTKENSGATFSSLYALLSSPNLSTLIPTNVRTGGMTIRFAHTSDNKYVQYRLMTTTWSNSASNWQGVDDEPQAGSKNLVKSGGVESILYHQIFNKDIIVTSTSQDIALREFDYGAKVAVRIVSNSSTLASAATVNVGIRKKDTSSIYKVINDSWTILETTENNPFDRIYLYVNGEVIGAGTIVLETIFKDAFNANIFDTIPTENSKKAIESGAVYAGLAALSNSIEAVDTNAKNGISELREDIDGSDNYTSGGWIGQDGLTITSNSDYAYSDYIDVTEGDNITVRKDVSEIDLYASFYPVNEGEIVSYTLSAGSVSRNISVPSGYKRLRFSFKKDRDAKVLRGSTVIWEKTHEKGITEKLGDTVQVVEQSLTTAQQNQAKANIGLPPGIDNTPLDESANLVTSGGVKSVVDKAEATAEIALSKIDGGSVNLLDVEKEINNEYINANTASFLLRKPSSKITICSTLTGENIENYSCYLYDKDGNRENSPSCPNGGILTITKSYEIVRIVVNYSASVRHTGTLTVVVEMPSEPGLVNHVNAIELEVNGGDAIIGYKKYHADNVYVNSTNLYAELTSIVRTFTFRLNVPDELGITGFAIYVFKTDGTHQSYGPFAPNTDNNFPDKGFDITKVSVSQIIPDAKYTGDFELKITAYHESPLARKEEVNVVKEWTGFDERVIVPDYYFENNYLDDKVNTIKNIYRNCAANADIFFFQTDEHWEMNTQWSPALTKYIADRVNINMLADGGDNVHNISLYDTTEQNPALDDYTILRKKCFDGRVYHTIGNHEYLVGYFHDIHLFDGIQFGNWHDRDWFGGYTEVVYGDTLKHYYYVDNKQKKIRYIFLSAFKQEEPTPAPSGNNRYWIKAVEDFDDVQQVWLRDIALNVETGWTIVVFSHQLSSINPTIDENGNCTNVSRTFGPNSLKIAKILLQYNGNGEIACVICGHLHADGVAYINDDVVGLSGSEATGKVIPEIVTTCDTGGVSSSHSMVFHGNDPHRDENTITEQAFDVVIIDKNIKKISLVRIGGKAFNIFEQDEQTGYYPLYGDLEIREVTYGNV